MAPLCSVTLPCGQKECCVSHDGRSNVALDSSCCVIGCRVGAGLLGAAAAVGEGEAGSAGLAVQAPVASTATAVAPNRVARTDELDSAANRYTLTSLGSMVKDR